jgi:hypothetical protein
MMGHVVGVLGPERKVDWLSRLNKDPDSAIAAEWEIAALYCLAKQGAIKAAPRRKGVRDLEVIYTSPTTGKRVAIEVTAVPDKSYYHVNPTEAFKDEVLRVTLKESIDQLGGIRFDIGSVPGSRGPILGLPPARGLAGFFQSVEFLQFIANIKTSPAQFHALPFEYNIAKSRLYFTPGHPTGGGGHLVHTLLFDPCKNPITSRLVDKDKRLC